ncbi:serine hydrolase [Ammonicoccus fulvus]|uniref:Serine hydrolase n=1 Tax=Ammonicoccus fulvus TaxID=3138240 RepID=A0ABZ3FND6_9ACTN
MSRTPLALIALVALLTLAALWWGTPRPPHVSDDTAGDATLAAQLREHTRASGHQSVAAAVITADSITHAAIGEATPGSSTPIQPADPIELGSITKTFNGFLLADAITRGEVGADDPVSTHLPELADSPIGAVTLTELATHRGGVPPLPPSVTLPSIGHAFTGSNPYAGATEEEVLAEVRTLELLDGRGEVQYSNLGASLLGWALANAAGAPDWDAHVHERLLDPLGIDATFATGPADIPPGTVPGYTSNGFHPEAWTSPAYRPAGSSTYISPAATAAYAQAILTDRVPGAEAMDPRFDAGSGQRIGLAWFTREHAGRTLTWHNGGTAGFRTMLAIDREAGRAVFTVSNTDAAVDDLAFTLLTGEDQGSGGLPVWLLALIPGVATLMVAGAWWNALRGRDRVALLSGIGGAVFAVALARILGDWATVGAWVWIVLTIATAGATAVAIRRWPQLPWHPKRFRVLRWINAGISLGLAVAALVFIRI